MNNSEVFTYRRKNGRSWMESMNGQASKGKRVRGNKGRGPEQDARPLLKVRWAKTTDPVGGR